LFITSTISSSGLANLTVGLSNIAAICLLFFGWLARTRIYKKKWLHVLESFFILNLGALSMGTLLFRYGGYVNLCSALTHLLVGAAFIMFLGIVGYHVHTQLNDNVTKFFQFSKFVKRMIVRIYSSKPEHDVRNDSATSDEGMDDLFHNIERRRLLPKN
jgi:small-conductance mechanosensitive channel